MNEKAIRTQSHSVYARERAVKSSRAAQSKASNQPRASLGKGKAKGKGKGKGDRAATLGR